MEELLKGLTLFCLVICGGSMTGWIVMLVFDIEPEDDRIFKVLFGASILSFLACTFIGAFGAILYGE